MLSKANVEPPQEVHLLLIRHGQTQANVDGRYAGRTAEGLTALGADEMDALSRRLATVWLHGVDCSPVRRAVQSADLLATPHQQVPTKDEELSELDLQAWEGMLASQVQLRFPVQWQSWQRNPASLETTGLESLSQLSRRASNYLSKVRQRPSGIYAAVTHEAVIRMLILVALGLPVRDYRAFQIETASLTILRLLPNKAFLCLMSDVSHKTNQGGQNLPLSTVIRHW